MADQTRSKSNTWFAKANHIKLKKEEVTKPFILDAAVQRAAALGKVISSGGGAADPFVAYAVNDGADTPALIADFITETYAEPVPVYGPELVTDGWTADTGWTQSGNTFTATSVANNSEVETTGVVTAGSNKLYSIEVTWDSSVTTGSWRVYLLQFTTALTLNTVSGVSGSASGLAVSPASGTVTAFRSLTAAASGNFTVSIKEITSYTPQATTFDDLITYTGASLSRMMDSDGFEKWNAHNLQRASQGDFDNGTYWRSSAATTVTDAATSDPDGLASYLVSGDGTAGYRIDNFGTGSGDYGNSLNAIQTFNVRVKAAPTDSAAEVSLALSSVGIRVNLSTGAFIGNASSPPSVGYTITDAGDGYWDIAVTTVKTNQFHFWVVNGDNGASVATGFLISRAYLHRSDFGGMVNNPDRGDSYVPTTSAAVYMPRRKAYYGPTPTLGGFQKESAAATNINTHSNDFSISGWWSTSTNISLTTGQTNSLTGASDAVLFSDSNGGGTDNAFTRLSSYTVTSGTNYTLSVYAKASGANFLWLGIYNLDGAALNFGWFNLGTGAKGTLGAGYSNATIEDVGGGWYRCSVTRSSTTDLDGSIAIGVSDADNTIITDLDGTSSILVYGAQFEEGSVPTSYIPTNGSTATRAAQTATIPAANLPYSPTAMSISTKGLFSHVDTGGTNAKFLRWYSGATAFIEQLITGFSGYTGGFQAVQSSGINDSVTEGVPGSYPPGVNVPFNVASRHGSTFINAAIDGTALTANTTPTSLPDLSTSDLELGKDYKGFISQQLMWGTNIADAGMEETSTP